MKESELLQHLEELAEKLHIKICSVHLKKDSYTTRSGLCKVRGRYKIIIDQNLHLSEKIDVLVDALQHFEVPAEDLHPTVRKLLARAGEGRP